MRSITRAAVRKKETIAAKVFMVKILLAPSQPKKGQKEVQKTIAHPKIFFPLPKNVSGYSFPHFLSLLFCQKCISAFRSRAERERKARKPEKYRDRPSSDPGSFENSMH